MNNISTGIHGLSLAKALTRPDPSWSPWASQETCWPRTRPGVVASSEQGVEGEAARRHLLEEGRGHPRPGASAGLGSGRFRALVQWALACWPGVGRRQPSDLCPTVQTSWRPAWVGVSRGQRRSLS